MAIYKDEEQKQTSQKVTRPRVNLVHNPDVRTSQQVSNSLLCKRKRGCQTNHLLLHSLSSIIQSHHPSYFCDYGLVVMGYTSTHYLSPTAGQTFYNFSSELKVEAEDKMWASKESYDI